MFLPLRFDLSLRYDQVFVHEDILLDCHMVHTPQRQGMVLETQEEVTLISKHELRSVLDKLNYRTRLEN